MKKKPQKIFTGEFEQAFKTVEKEYAELQRDYTLVVGWNEDLGERYNYLTEIMPTVDEVQSLKHKLGLRRYVGGKVSYISQDERKSIEERMLNLTKLELAVSRFNDYSPKFVVPKHHRHLFQKSALEEKSFWEKIKCLLKKNKT